MFDFGWMELASKPDERLKPSYYDLLPAHRSGNAESFAGLMAARRRNSIAA